MGLRVGKYCINVTDLARSVQFYEDGIGLTAVTRVNYHGLHEVVLSAEGGGGQIQLAYRDETHGPIQHGNALSKFYFDVDDCEAAHLRAIEAGAQSQHPPERLPDYPFTYSIVTDPDGYRIELLQRHAD